jgi:NAD(P)-dependent dehydrogenase (short-subunit alcohol dehydrogenase family)
MMTLRNEAAMRRTALVTGGGLRIGRAIVEDLAAAGWAVAIHHNRSGAAAAELAAAIVAKGGRAATVAGDLADLAAPAAILAAATAALGPINLLVNSASVFSPDAYGALDGVAFERQMRVNLTAPLLLQDAFVRQLPEGEEGLVVHIVDQRVKKPVPSHVSYMLSKAGLATAIQTAAQALAPRIRVNGIGPGPTLKAEAQTEAEFQAQVDTVLLKRGPALGEFGRLIRAMVELPSMTGQIVMLDGGQHLAWETPDVLGGGPG